MKNITKNNNFITHSQNPNPSVKFGYTQEKDQLYWDRTVKNFIILLKDLLINIKKGSLINFQYVRVNPKSIDISKLFLCKKNDTKSISDEIYNSLLNGDAWDVNKQKLIDQVIIEDEGLLKARVKDIIFYLENLVSNSYSTTPKKPTGQIVEDNNLNLSTFLNQTTMLNNIVHINEIESINIIDKYNKNNLYNIGFNNFVDIKRKPSEDKENDFVLPEGEQSLYRVGLLDSKIHESFKNKFDDLMNYESYIDDEGEFLESNLTFSHMEAVFSCVAFGDKINNFDDGAGIIKTKTIAVLGEEERNTTIESVYKRIEKAVKQNPDIKIWILSLGIEGKITHKNRVSTFGFLISKLSRDFDVKFFIAAGNEGVESYICPPSDSPNSITISSLDDIDGKIADYSSKGYVGLLGTKPNFSYFGGSIKKPINVLTTNIDGNVKIIGDCGTSYANPMAARIYSAIYHSPNFKDHEKTLAIMNIAAIKNTEKSIYDTPHWIYGLGKLPNHLSKYDSETLMNTNYTFGEDSRYSNYSEDKYISLPKISGEYPYNLLVSKVDKSDFNYDNGVKFTNSSVEVSIFKSKGNGNNNVVSPGAIKRHEFRPLANYMILPDGSSEASAIDNGKWVNTFVSKYDISKISKKLNGDEFIKLKVTKNIRDAKRTKEIDGWLAWEFDFHRELTPAEKIELVNNIDQMHKSQNHEVKVETIKISVPTNTI